MAVSRSKSQLSLPPMEVGNQDTRSRAVLNQDTTGTAVLSQDIQALPVPSVDAARVASELFASACRDARLTPAEVAYLCGVSENLVNKWQNPNDERCPSFAQMLCLPFAFHLAVFGLMNRRFGFARAAVTRLLSAVGDVAVLGGF